MGTNDAKALKSGIWYTAASFLTKSIGFITTPLFTRLLTHEQYGLYSNYTSWLSTFTIFATLALATSFISARFDFEDDFDGYVLSTLVLSSIVTCAWALVINLSPTFFMSLTTLDIKYINIMVVYLLMFSAVDMFQSRERYYFEYKITVLTSVGISVLTAVLSVILVLAMEDKLLGRVLGSALPTIIIGVFLYGVLLRRGKKITIKYWLYALPICLPYIPHTLSLSLLNSMDKMMVTKICGAEANALYSVAYTCGAVVTLLISALNTAFSPWLGEKLNGEHYNEIRKISKPYILLFTYLVCGILLFTPELLLFMGGPDYSEATAVMPPVALGCVCQFLYTLYVNVEQFKKKTLGMAVASVVATLVNYVLNALLIPAFGYVAAGYTTLLSYLTLLLIHMLLVRHMGLAKTYPTKLVFIVIVSMGVYALFVHYLYMNTILRYVIIGVYILVTLTLIIKNKMTILSLLKARS